MINCEPAEEIIIIPREDRRVRNALRRRYGATVFIHLPLIRREEEWRDVAGRGVRRQGDR